MSNPFASGSNSEPIGGIQPNDGGGGSAFPQTSSGIVKSAEIKSGCKKCGYPGHLTFQCRNFIQLDPVKDVVLDVSSTSSESDGDDYSTPLTTLRAAELKAKKKKKAKKRRASESRGTSSEDSDSEARKKKKRKKEKKKRKKEEKKAKKKLKKQRKRSSSNPSSSSS
jgi:hypothetical protein